MDYVLLIYQAEERAHDSLPPAERHETLLAYGRYTREVAATGKLGDCAPLESVRTATSVRVRDGKRVVTDGPFAETREQLGGYYVVSADSEEEALSLAERIPGARTGSIEVRPAASIGASPTTSATPRTREKKEYVLLIYEPDAYWTGLEPTKRQALVTRYLELTRSMREDGSYVEGSPLESTKRAKTVRVSGGKRIVTDGPFAETREQLAGYYRVRADHLDQALDYAARIPAAESGTIEVRPLFDFSEYA